MAWRLRRGAILALCFGYLLVGFVVGLQSALAWTIAYPAVVGHEIQYGVAFVAALVLIITGIAVHRQIATLNVAS